MLPFDIALITILLLIVIIFGFIKKRNKIKRKKILKKLKGKQLKCFEVLEKNGFVIKDVNCRIDVSAETDRKIHTHTFKCSLLVKKGKRSYIVYNIKKGKEFPRLSVKKDREVLMNLCNTFGVNGAIIYDDDKNKIRTIEFKKEKIK